MAVWTLSDLLPGTTYYVQVRTNAGDRYSEYSQRFTVTTVADTTPPDVPTGYTTVVDGDTFVCSWTGLNATLDQNKDLNHYELSLTDGSTTQVISILPAQTKFIVTFEQNRNMFGTAKATVTGKVRSVDNTGNASAYTGTSAATNPAPSNITGLTTTALNEAIAVAWSANTDADLLGYRVDLSTTGVGGTYSTIYTGKDNNFTYPSTLYGTDHFFKVYAVDKFNTVSATAATSGAVRPKSSFIVDTTAPNIPTSLVATITNNTNGIGARAAVSWVMSSPPSDLAGYVVRFRKVGDTNYTSLGFTSDVLAGIVELGSAYQDYEFQIRAFDWMNNYSSWSSTVTATSPANAAPGTVTGVAMSAGRDAATVSWTESTDADVKNGNGMYEVTFSTSATFASGNTTYRTGALSLTVSALSPSTQYYARVKAVDSGNVMSASWSSTVSATTLAFPTPPASDGLVPSSSPAATVSSGFGFLDVKWTATTNADKVTYEVHLGTVTGFTPSGATKCLEIDGTACQIYYLPGTSTPLTYGTTYFVKILAKDVDGPATTYGTQGSGSTLKIVNNDVNLNIRNLGVQQVYYQGTAPASGMVLNDVWFDTSSNNKSYYYNGTTWVSTQDAGIAVAQATANAAQTSANGKNTITYNTSAPTTSSAGIVGDTWFVRNVGTGIVTAQYESTGGSGPSSYTWVAKTLDNAVIANLDAGKLTAGTLDVANRISAGSISTSKMIIGDFQNYLEDPFVTKTGSWTATGSFTFRTGITTYDGSTGTAGSFLAAGSARTLTNSNVISCQPGDQYTISAWTQQIGVTTPTGSSMLQYVWKDSTGASTIVSVPGATKSLATMVSGTWYKISGTFTVPANAVSFTIRANTGSSVAPGDIYYTNFEARRLNSGSLIVDGTIIGTKLIANTITSAQIAANTISTNNLNVAVFEDSVIANGSFDVSTTTIDSWTQNLATTGTAPAWSITTATANVRGGGNAATALVAATSTGMLSSDLIPITPGDIYDLQWAMKVATASTGSVNMRAVFITSNNVNAKSGDAGTATVEGFASPPMTTLTTTYQQFNAYVTVPAGSYRYMRLEIDVNSLGTGYTLYIDDVLLRRITGSAQIADASIITAKIANLAVTNAQINDASISKLTTGNLSTATMTLQTGGIIQSALYVSSAGASGFSLTDSALIIKSGSIDAGTLTTGSTITTNLFVTGTLTTSTTGKMQSANYVANTTGYKIDATGVDIGGNGFINAGSLKAGTISATTISLGATGLLTIDSTGALQSNNYALNSTGYKLSSAGLEVNDGTIDAKAIKTSTISASVITLGSTGTIKSSNYVATTTGWSLGNGALEINTGTIRAASLLLQTNNNIVAPMYADFEGNISAYTGLFTLFAGSAAIDTVDFKFNTQSLRWTPGSTFNTIVFGTSNSDFNFIVNPGSTYIVSYYAMVKTGGVAQTALQPIIRYNATVVGTVNGASTAVPANSVWNRYSTTITIPGTATGGAQLYFFNTLAGVIYLDGIQVEEQMSASTTPSSWAPPSSTSINGGQIRTGSIQSNQTGFVWDSTANTYVVDPAAQPMWVINTTGQATFSDVLVKGRIIIGTGAEGAGVLPAASSGNYIPGVQGWMIRSDGSTEFRNMVANSLSADALVAGSLTADKIASGTINSNLLIAGAMSSIDSTVSAITNKILNTNVATLTTATNHGRSVGDRVVITDVDATFNTPTGSVDIVTAVAALNTFAYARVATNVGTTAVVAPAAATFYGRSVNIDPQGLHLVGPDGVTTIVDIPTNPQQQAYFSGQGSFAGLNVSNNFTLNGTSNNMTIGSVLTLAAATTAPATTPTVATSYDNFKTWINGTGNNTNRYGLFFDGVQWLTLNSFYGSQAFTYGANGGFLANVGLDQTSGAASPNGGLVKLGGFFYALVYRNSDQKWWVFKYDSTGTGFSTRIAFFNYDLAAAWGTTAKQWRATGDGGTLKDPTIGTDGTNILIARCDLAGKARISSFTTTGTFNSTITTDISDNQDLRSVLSGTMDFGGSRYVITTHGNSTKAAQNYVTNTSGVQQTTETFPSPNGLPLTGTFWTGAAFASLTDSGYHYTHTALGNGVNLSWSTRSTWYNQDLTSTTVTAKGLNLNIATLTFASHPFVVGDWATIAGVDATFNGTYVITAVTSTTISYAKTATNVTTVASGGTAVRTDYETDFGQAQSFNAIRRSKLTMGTTAIPGAGARNDPKAAMFYVSTNGSTGPWYAQSAYTLGRVSQTFTATPTATGASTAHVSPIQLFAGSTPSKVVSSNGLLELNSGGYAVFGSTTDVTNLAGNTPALRLGDINGLHLRMDGNEIMAMATTSTQGNLYLNIGDRVVLPEKTWQTNKLTMTPATANTAFTSPVTFATSFKSVPAIYITVMTGISSAITSMAWPSSVTTSGFTMNYIRGNTTPTVIRWVAVDVPADGSGSA